jgi:carboxypeptidase D
LDILYSALLEVNPCFNIYHITETCPHPFSQLGIVNTGDYQPPGAVVYFNRSDVTAALHAVPGTNWQQCTDVQVFGQGNNSAYFPDLSLGPAQNGVLERVIEFTNNTLIGSGDLDFLLSTNGTLLAIQNLTWYVRVSIQISNQPHLLTVLLYVGMACKAYKTTRTKRSTHHITPNIMVAR